MTTEQIISLVISICPSAVAILTACGVVLRVMHAFKELKREVTDMKSIEQLQQQLGQVIEENYQLKRKLNETLTKIDRIKRD